jgi:3-keto-5-aminohexanoate cleavage enzyme
VEGLLAHLRFLPDGPIEWTVCNKIGNPISQVATAIEMGGHAAVGLGDYAWPELGQPHNGDVVGFVANLSRAMGREVATPGETREGSVAKTAMRAFGPHGLGDVRRRDQTAG